MRFNKIEKKTKKETKHVLKIVELKTKTELDSN